MCVHVQVGKAKVQFACASALAMLVEGEAEMCPQVLRHGGLTALTTMLHTAGAQGRKAAAEALQVQHLCPSSTQLTPPYTCFLHVRSGCNRTFCYLWTCLLQPCVGLHLAL